MSTLGSVTDADFENVVIKASKPVLVDFWAEWCNPCRAIAPILEEIAPAYADKLTILKLNVDESPEIPVKFNVRNIPTLMLFANGSVEATKVGGNLSKSQLAAFLDSHIS